MRKSTLFFLGFFILIQLCILIFSLTKFGIIQDEYYHVNQIARFYQGDFSLNPALTVFPTYHFIVAIILKYTGVWSLDRIRIISSLISIPAIFIFFKIAQTLDKKSALSKTIRFAFFPLIFPFFFLAYTDIFSLFFILLTCYFTLKKQYTISGFFGLFAILVRQTNVVWVVFFFVLAILSELNGRFAVKHFLKILPRMGSFILCIGLFILYFLYHGNIGSGDYYSQRISSLVNTGNIYLFLFLFFVLFLPENIARLKMILHWNVKKWVFILIFAFAGFFIFKNTLSNTHPYNQAWWFLHNFLVVLFNRSLLWKIFYYVIVVTSLLLLGRAQFREKRYYILYPFIIASLLPVWIIEFRYMFVPFALFLLFVKDESINVSKVTGAVYILVDALLFWGILTRMFFL